MRTGAIIACGALLLGTAAGAAWWVAPRPVALELPSGPARRGDDPLREIREALSAARTAGPADPADRLRLATGLAPVLNALSSRFRSDPDAARAALDAIESETDPGVAVAAASVLAVALASVPDAERAARRGGLLSMASDQERPLALRLAALEALGPPREDSERRALVALLAGRLPVRLAGMAAQLLGKDLPHPASREALVRACGEGIGPVRGAALAALCDAGDPEAGNLAHRAFCTEVDPRLRDAALERAVRILPKDGIRSLLASTLELTRDPGLRETALEALAADPHPDARAAVARAAKEDPDDAIRAKAARLAATPR